jgi:hypothetical protein
MACFDRRLIDPGPEEFLRAFGELVRATNGPTSQWPDGQGVWDNLLVVAKAHPEGTREWPVKIDEWAETGWEGLAIRVSWWTDHIRRRHFRLVSRYLEATLPTRPFPFQDHPLAQVYPESTLLRTRGERVDLLAVCGCGAVGCPESLGWAGERCGPCHDKLEEGVSLPWGAPFEGRKEAGRVSQLTFGKEGQLIALQGENVFAWGPNGGTPRRLWPVGEEEAPLLAVSPDGEWAAEQLGEDVVLRHLPRQELISLPQLREGWRARLALFSPDGRWLALLTNKGVLVNTAAPSSSPTPIFDAADEVDALAFTPDGNHLFSADLLDGFSRPRARIVRVDTRTGQSDPLPGPTKVLLPIRDDSAAITGLACSPDGRWLVVSCQGDSGGGFRICDLRDGKWSPVKEPADPCSTLAISPDNSTLAVAGHEAAIALHDLGREEEIARLRWQGDYPTALAFSPDGETLAVAERYGTIRLLPWRRLLEAP